MIDPKLLAILRCPIDGSALELAEESLIRQVQAAISRGEIRDRLEQKVSDEIEGGLVNAKRCWLYPIRNKIPTLVAEEAIDIQSIDRSE